MYLSTLMVENGPPFNASFIFYLLTLLSKIYPTTGVTLFCLLLLLISTELKSIRCKLINHQTSMTSNELKSLKRQHAMICRSVEKINQLFGYTVLVEVVTVFIGTVSNMVYLLPGVVEGFTLSISVSYTHLTLPTKRIV